MFIGFSNDDYGFVQLKIRGNAAKGRGLVRHYGCTTCHIVGDIGAGRAGPALTDFAERQYIAGVLVNVPATAMAWIANPKRFKPETAMPNLSVQPGEAAHIAAYLYTFGNQKRLEALRKTATGSQ
jgi:cytochrome c oxidase subunit 2